MGCGQLLLGDPIKTLDHKFENREMVPFDEFQISSRLDGPHIANQILLDNRYFRIVLDTKVDFPVVVEFLKLRQEATTQASTNPR